MLVQVSAGALACDMLFEVAAGSFLGLPLPFVQQSTPVAVSLTRRFPAFASITMLSLAPSHHSRHMCDALLAVR